MTNKPMLSVELRVLLERVVKGVPGSAWAALDDDRLAATEELRALLDKPAECRCKRYGKDNPHWPCPVHAEPAAQHQGEPVAQVVRTERSERGNSCDVVLTIPGNLKVGDKLYRQRGHAKHTMWSVMEAVGASKAYTVLTSNQCKALADALNEVKP